MRLLVYDVALFLRDKEDMRKSQHLITQEVETYMTLYEVDVSAPLQFVMSLNAFIAE